MAGLDKDGGISFSRKRNFNEKEEDKKPYGLAEPKEEIPEPRNVDVKELAKTERLNKKFTQAKRIHGTGFAVNSTSVIGILFYLDSAIADPNTLETLNNINEMFNLNIDFEKILITLQNYKAQIVTMFVGSQTMLLGYRDTVKKMRERGNENFYEVFTEELEKVGI